MLADLDVRSVQRADRRRPVQREFHVAGARRFLSGRRDLLAEVRRRDQPLGQRDVVVRHVDDLQELTRVGIGIHHPRHVIDETDDLLRQVIPRRGLAREQPDPRDAALAGIILQLLPMRDRLEDVEVLPLVFVDALDLDVEHRVGIEADTGGRLDPVRQLDLVGPLGRRETVEEPCVLDMSFQVCELVEVSLPAWADRVLDQSRQPGVGRQDPAPRRHAVGLVDDPLGVEPVQLGEHRLFHQLGVQGRDPVHPVCHDEGQVPHLDLPVLADGHPPGRVTLGMQLVDPRDDLHVPRQQASHQPFRPPLQRLRHQRVVGVTQGRLRGVGGHLEFHPALVHQ